MRIKGGLGNQLFQYSVAYALSKRLEQPFLLDVAFTDNMTERKNCINDLNIDAEFCTNGESLPFKIKMIKNKYINKVLRIFNLSKHRCGDYLYWIETRDKWQKEFNTIKASNLYVDGYFQCEEYFKQYRENLLHQFVPKYVYEKEYNLMLEQIKRYNSVAIHVRRGDFKRAKNKFHYVLPETYYINAIDFIKEKVMNPVFFCFSDDLEWIRRRWEGLENFIFVDINTEHKDIDELMLMKNCQNIIAANSTFSWWGAWLNENEDAIIIVPKKDYGMEGMIPSTWNRI